jgi:peroxiredoxin Q/BCP
VVGIGAVGAIAAFIALRSAGTTPGTSVEAAGAPLGKAIPAENIALPATTGHDIALSQYRGKKLVVYLYEGISCGPCQGQLQMLQQNLGKIRAAGGDVVAVSIDPMNVSQSAAQQMRLGFPILVDSNHQLGDAFKDFHLATAGMDMGPVDNHAMFILDGKGVVRWKSMAAATMNVNMSDMLSSLRHTS